MILPKTLFNLVPFSSVEDIPLIPVSQVTMSHLSDVGAGYDITIFQPTELCDIISHLNTVPTPK